MLEKTIRLIITTPHGKVFERDLRGDRLIIGRSSSSDLCIGDSSMSRRHARIFREEDNWYLEDLGSRNGCRINGETFAGQHPLRLGDRITIGETSLVITEGGPEELSTEPLTGARTVFRSATEILDRRSLDQEGDDILRLRRLAGRLKLLNDLNSALGGPIRLEELLELILERVFSELRPEQGGVFLRNASGQYVCSCHRGGSRRDVERLCSRKLQEEVIEKGQGALVNDTTLDERFRDSESLVDAGIRSFLAAPLLGPEGGMGMLVLCSKARNRIFSEDDLELLVSLASIAALRLRNLRLVQVEAERRRNLELARKIQLALLPKSLPEIPGYRVHAGNQPSQGISGDFYKVVSRAEGREVLFLLADASGKGVGASLLTGVFESLSAAPIENGWPPEEIVETVSRLLWARTDAEKYATAVLLVLEPESGRLSWVNAGHPPGFLIRQSGAVENLSSTGLPVALFPDQKYSVGHASMEPGDTVCLYSDGLTEAENSEDEEFGVSRLRDLCLTHRNEAPKELAGCIEEELNRFTAGVPFADDRTVVILRRN